MVITNKTDFGFVVALNSGIEIAKIYTTALGYTVYDWKTDRFITSFEDKSLSADEVAEKVAVLLGYATGIEDYTTLDTVSGLDILYKGDVVASISSGGGIYVVRRTDSDDWFATYIYSEWSWAEVAKFAIEKLALFASYAVKPPVVKPKYENKTKRPYLFYKVSATYYGGETKQYWALATKASVLSIEPHWSNKERAVVKEKFGKYETRTYVVAKYKYINTRRPFQLLAKLRKFR